MTKPDQLEALARATETVQPSDDFADALMDQIMSESVAAAPSSQPGAAAWRNEMVRTGRFAVAVAAVAAAACLTLSMFAQSEYDQEVMATIDVLEVSD